MCQSGKKAHLTFAPTPEVRRRNVTRNQKLTSQVKTRTITVISRGIQIMEGILQV